MNKIKESIERSKHRFLYSYKLFPRQRLTARIFPFDLGVMRQPVFQPLENPVYRSRHNLSAYTHYLIILPT